MQRKGETAFFFCTAVSERNRMNSFMSWVGGKKALRDAIVARLCCSCDRYVEVFGGGAWVLFHKLPGKFEVYNDFNPNLANLYRCVRDHPEELCEELRYTLNARVDFDHIREVLRTKTVIPDIRRAAYFYQIIRESYASGLDSFGAQPHNMWRNFPLITEASKRLQSVVIENKDFEKLIQQYDRPNTIFYLDPPYYETEDYYEDVGFGTADHETDSKVFLLRRDLSRYVFVKECAICIDKQPSLTGCGVASSVRSQAWRYSPRRCSAFCRWGVCSICMARSRRRHF